LKIPENKLEEPDEGPGSKVLKVGGVEFRISIIEPKEQIEKEQPLPATAFDLYRAGVYDMEAIKGLPWADYRPFVLKLFGVSERPHERYGMRLDGYIGRTQALEEFERGEGAATLPSLPGEQPANDAAVVPLVTEHPDQTLWGPSRIAAYRTSLTANLGAPLGVLAIPKIDVRVPVFDGTDDITLNRGVGRIEGTAAIGTSGNLGIAGHRDGFFRGLKDIVVGDAIDLRSRNGTVRYQVSEILIVDPTDVYVLDPTDHATLTLVTCYPFYFVGSAPQRYIVKATAQGLEQPRLEQPRSTGSAL
jgi:LPXTG-site transpeptidase (sortase) family protein